MATDSSTYGSFDIFVSYAHADDGNNRVAALVAEIEAEYRRVTGTPFTRWTIGWTGSTKGSASRR